MTAKKNKTMTATIASGLLAVSAQGNPSPSLPGSGSTAAEDPAGSITSKIKNAGLVEVDASIEVFLVYAQEDPTGEINFLKKNVYGDLRRCFLQPNVATKLNDAQKILKKILGNGATLVVYDCARPLSVQRAMWAILPDTTYVADPQKGSKHNFGASVDVTFRFPNGKIADMGSRFDHFGTESDFRFVDLAPEAKRNRAILRRVMMKAGFLPYDAEWWHFDGHPSPRTTYKILDF
jgi:D-alanyl-D-alanine dipeptidase